MMVRTAMNETAIVNSVRQAVRGIDRDLPIFNLRTQTAQIDATKFLMCVNRAKFVGKATPEQWEDTVKIFAKIGVLPENVPATAYYTYDYLPPEAQLRSSPLK